MVCTKHAFDSGVVDEVVNAIKAAMQEKDKSKKGAKIFTEFASLGAV